MERGWEAAPGFFGRLPMEIKRWRAEAARRPRFRLRDFHDRLLAVGSRPLPALRPQLEAAGDHDP